MATIRQQPDPLDAVGYPGSNLSIRVLKSGFAPGAVLSCNVFVGKGDDISDLKNDMRPEVKNPAAALSEIFWTGVQTSVYKLPDYTLEILVDGVVHTSGSIRFTRETTTVDPNTEPLTLNRGGEQILMIRPTGASETKFMPVSAGVTTANGIFFTHGLNCDGIIARAFGGATSTERAELEGPKLFPLTGEAGYDPRNSAYLDLAGYDLDQVRYIGFIPFYA